MATVAAPATHQAVLLYDGQCPLCQRSVAVLRRLDWLGKLHIQDARDVAHLPPAPRPLDPQALLREMHLVTPGARAVHAGFFAFRWLAGRLPLLLPLMPLLYLPGVPAIGQRIYLWVAKNRFDLVPCHDGECRLPDRPAKQREQA